MDTHTVLDCCLAVPGGHSDPGSPGGSQPLHRAGVLEHASRRWSLPCCSASSPCHSGLPGTTPTVGEASHLAPVRSLSGAGRDPNALHFAAPSSHGRERIFGSRLNQERPFPVLSLRRLLLGKQILP